jgi:hypothetical protein
MSKAVIFSLALLVMAGCSNTGRSYTGSTMVETLEVEILPNTSKMFTYRLRMPEPKVRFGGRRGENGPGGVDIGRKTHERLLENTAYVVEQSGYCREGFFELDRRISPHHLWIRGECKDGATKEDQSAFGEKQLLTSERWKKINK